MEFKKLTLALLTASVISGCGGNDGDNPSSTHTNDKSSVSSTSCMTISAEKLCVNTEFAAQSGDRLYIPISGNIPENVTLSWTVTESGELKAPVFSEDSKGAYIVAPVSESAGTVQIQIKGATDDQSEEGNINTSLKVAGGHNLTINGINNIIVDENSLMTVEWLPATDSAGNLATSPEYTLTVTRLIDGQPSNDVEVLTSSITTASLNVLPGETYRLILSVKSVNGEITYAEQFDYVVADKLPELASYVTDSSPVADRYNEGQIIDQDGTFMIVREMEDGTKVIEAAEEYELYSPDAPLVVTLRIKDIDDESLSSLASDFNTYSSGHKNSFSVEAQNIGFSSQATDFRD